MTKAEFSYLCGYGAEHWPLLYWPSRQDAIKWLHLIQEDWTFTNDPP